jgi:16S rRNA processing protein RimM
MEGLANEMFRIGTVVGVHGLRGELKIKTSLSNLDLIEDISTVQLQLSGQPTQKATVHSMRIAGGIIFLSLEEFAVRTQAETIVGATVSAEKVHLRALAENEWWIKDLIGMEVFTTDGTLVGTVCDVFEGKGSGSILEIRTKAKVTSLVPFVNELVPVVDISSKRIEIINLPGLVQLE